MARAEETAPTWRASYLWRVPEDGKALGVAGSPVTPPSQPPPPCCGQDAHVAIPAVQRGYIA
ncbi:MAG TPA: hypothetical protein VF516_20215 [Kofleriaceae bacterium]